MPASRTARFGTLLFVLAGSTLIPSIAAQAATMHVACAGTADELNDALAALQNSPDNNDGDEIRIRVGSYVAPTGGWVGAVTDHHDLAIRGGYIDALCQQHTDDASMTVLDGANAAGVLTINTPLIPNSNIEVSGLTIQNGSGSVAFGNAVGGLKIGDPGPISGGNILVERNIFRNNAAASAPGSTLSGGLLAATDGASLIVRDNLFVNNTAPNMPAAFVFSNNEIDVSNNTFVGNHATDTTIDQRVMFDFFTLAALKLSNNVFWGNALGDKTFDLNLSGQSKGATLVNNDIESATGTAVAASGTLHVNPGFMAADDLRLAPDSPLINAGVGDPAGGIGAVDLDGAPRIDGPGVDLGAYESSYLFVNGFE